MSTLQVTLPSKMKRFIHKMLGLSHEDKSDLVKVIEVLVQFGRSVSVQAERTKMGRMFQSEGESIDA